MDNYYNSDDFKKFGNIVDFQKEMGEILWVLRWSFQRRRLDSQRKSLIALAVSMLFNARIV
jgi:hypothetical protein